MATIARLLSSSYSSASTFLHNDSYSISSQTFSRSPNRKTTASSLKLQPNDQGCWLVKDTGNLDFKKMETGTKIYQINCTTEYDKGLRLSQEKLVIAHFSANYKSNLKIQRFMEERCRVSSEVKFLHVMANNTEKTRQLCTREYIEKIPYFVFYKKMEKIHEEEGFQPEKLVSNILYYGDDPFSHVVQLQSGEDLEKLIKVHRIDHKLIVVNVGMTQCIPCVKIYPSVLKLASQMAGRVVFARMNADENDSCMQMLREMDVSRVPAFLFLKNGELCGRYIGSCASTLIREIMKLRADQTISALTYSSYVQMNECKSREFLESLRDLIHT